MSTPVLNNGLFLRDTTYKVSSHLDSYHLLDMLGRNAEPMDLGPVDMWALGQRVQMPLYQLSNFGGSNVIEVDNPKGEFKWEIGVVKELPYIVEDLDPTNCYKGIDGTSFKIKLNKREFGHGDIITYNKYNGIELYISQEDDIVPVSDGFIYTVQLVNNDNYKFMDNRFLKPGTQFFRKGSARGEYGERYSDITVEKGSREFYNFVGNAEAHVHYSVSQRAKLMLDLGVSADGRVPVTEIWRCFDKNIDPELTSFDAIVKTMGKEYVKQAYSRGDLRVSFLTKLDAAHVTKISKDIENYIMWGHGGRVKQDGPDDIRLSVGLWKQLDNSFKRVYNKSGFSMEMFRSEIYNFLNGKEIFKGPEPEREITIMTGVAGMRMVNEAIKREAASDNFITVEGSDKSGIGAITGRGFSLSYGYAFTEYVIPFLARIKFVINPALDPVEVNDISNPIIDGYPLSSYSFIVFDITDNTNNNLYLLKRKYEGDLKYRYINGTMDYLGRTSGFQSSGNFNGYKVYMTQAYPAIWVKDPTKVLKIVMRNPIDGSSL